ncbi:MarR family transcriptional regulator [Paenibacillus sp. MZ04-78.2]|uniref:MarR family transcriptional regulator n=1 Tax=Paenibacillus sp. MZ04-78.2 TaxID=2962034 RepID=UPI0020B84F32|nr:MarR family transcriptional regulator [Paenibacillus sp. MZ04-78.2]MCP3773259.1 MarR family transcriptional regulator [Paenibacillus sp. MZ04-78.2]
MKTTQNTELTERLIKDRGMEVFLNLMEAPATAGELSDRLGFSRAKINYILDTMLKQDFIALHSEKVNGSVVEKCYTSNANTFHLFFGRDNSEADKVSAILYMLDTMKSNLIVNLNNQDSFHLGMVHAKIPPERAREYMERLRQLQAEFDDENLVSDDPDCRWYTMAVSLFHGPTPSLNLDERN